MSNAAICRSELLNHSAEVNQLCASLQKQLNISYFNYVRLCKDSKRILLTNRPKYIDDFYKKNQQEDNTVTKIERLEYDQYFTWDMFDKTPAFSEAKREYNIANGLTVIKPFPNYTELYYFGTTRENKTAPELYRSNLDLFDHFILYFRDKGRKLIDHASTMPLVSDTEHAIKENNTKAKNDKIITDFERFRYVFHDDKGDHLFSKNETAFLIYYSLQYSKREIALVVNVCENTVEYYLEKFQNLFGCFTRHEILQKIDQLKLIDLKNKSEKKFSTNPKKKIDFKLHSNYLKSTPIRKLYLDSEKNEIFLTKKEAACLFHFCHGYSAKEIGRMMNSSYRTIEQHIYIIKKKLGIHKKSGLAKYCLNHEIFDMIILAFPELVTR